ncbi:MAG: chemotaxis protein CheW [Aquabacterium sp.]
MDATPLIALLVCEAQGQLCGLPIEHVGETLRCPPLSPIPDAPDHVVGMAVIRGQMRVVLDLGCLLGQARTHRARLVTLRRAETTAQDSAVPACALAVDEVQGVRHMPSGAVQALPTLATAPHGSLIRGTSVQERELMAVLDAVRLMALAEQAAGHESEAS